MKSSYGHYGKRDEKSKAIIGALRCAGCEVADLSDTRGGIPDILVSHARAGKRNILIEIKSDDGKLTPAQEEFHARWKGELYIVHNEVEALRVMGLA